MRKPSAIIVLCLLVAMTLVTSAYAYVNVQAEIGEESPASFEEKLVNSPVLILIVIIIIDIVMIIYRKIRK